MELIYQEKIQQNQLYNSTNNRIGNIKENRILD